MDRRESRKQLLESHIQRLAISDERKSLLRDRWLDQVLWMEGRSARKKRSYYGWRLTAIVGAVIVPTLAGLSVSDEGVQDAIRFAVIAVGLVVAVSSAVEGFLKSGDQWRHYRQTVESLLAEGWEYFQLAGRYAAHTHDSAFTTFAARVEQILREEVAVFVTEVTEGDGSEEPPAGP
jgi:hypothetical protein